jgi:hypothetical protein
VQRTGLTPLSTRAACQRTSISIKQVLPIRPAAKLSVETVEKVPEGSKKTIELRTKTFRKSFFCRTMIVS